MHRCLELARLGAGYTAPNPMVGAVLVYRDRIIGEGYHERYGEAHAEVNCIRSVNESDRALVPASTLYVSLEPCAHYGKTPPCADLVIEQKIPQVVIACRDPFEQVDGKGIEKLQKAGVETIIGVLEKDAIELNKRFFCFHQKKRPYIVLKWAQTVNGKISGDTKERLLISNDYSNQLVHRWRSEEAAILVGTNTALYDDPELTNRLWSGPSPLRVVLDKNLRLPENLKLFMGQPTLVLTYKKKEGRGNIRYHTIDSQKPLISEIIRALYSLNIQSVLVEGGPTLLQGFLDAELWDEARVITNTQLYIKNGLDAPRLKNARHTHSQQLLNDTVAFYTPNS